MIRLHDKIHGGLGESPDQIIVLGLEIGTDTDHLPDNGIQRHLTQSVVAEVQSFFNLLNGL